MRNVLLALGCLAMGVIIGWVARGDEATDVVDTDTTSSVTAPASEPSLDGGRRDTAASKGPGASAGTPGRPAQGNRIEGMELQEVRAWIHERPTPSSAEVRTLIDLLDTVAEQRRTRAWLEIMLTLLRSEDPAARQHVLSLLDSDEDVMPPGAEQIILKAWSKREDVDLSPWVRTWLGLDGDRSPGSSVRGVTPSALVDYLVVHGDQEARRELEAHEHTGIRQAAWRALVREEPERALARYERVVAEGSNPDLTRSVLHAMAWNRVPGAVDVLEQLLRDVAAGKRLPEGVTLDTVMQYYVHPMPPSEFERAIGFLRDLGSLRLGIRFLDVLPDLHARGRDLTVFQPMAATMGSTLLRLHAKASKTPEEDRVWRILIRSMAWTAPPTLSQANLEAVEKAAEGLQGEERHRLENTAKSMRRALEERPWR